MIYKQADALKSSFHSGQRLKLPYTGGQIEGGREV